MKNYLLIAATVIVFFLGMFTNYKLTKAPTCNCPEITIPKCPPSIEVQSLDLDKIRKIKGDFTFSPVYNGDVYMVNKTDTIKQ